jgi:hypothetical protein
MVISIINSPHCFIYAREFLNLLMIIVYLSPWLLSFCQSVLDLRDEVFNQKYLNVGTVLAVKHLNNFGDKGRLSVQSKVTQRVNACCPSGKIGPALI